VSESQPKAAAQMVAWAKGRVENLTPKQLATERWRQERRRPS